MEWYFVAIGLLSLLILFICLGLPIPFALAAASIPFLLSIQSISTTLVTTQLKLWGVWVDYILLAVPLFVMIGEVIGRSSIGPNLFKFLHRNVPLNASAAYGSIGASAGFGSVCGSSMVGAITIGGVALPEMLRLGYNKRLSSGALAAGGTLSVLIPPSLILLFYGIVTDQSIGELFLAGMIPGILLAMLFVFVIVMWGIYKPDHVPKSNKDDKMSLILSLKAIIPLIFIGLVITLPIYLGIATPTEAAGLACVFTIFLAFVFGSFTLKAFFESIKATMLTMGYLGLLLSAGVMFGFVFTYFQIPQEFTKFFLGFELSPYAILFVIIIFYIALGMFLEPVSMTFITLPTLYPLVSAAGFDLIWFGIIYTITMEIAVLTPPVGLNLYVIQAIAKKDLTIIDVILGCIPFILAMVFLLILITIFPEIALWVPGLSNER